MPIEKQYKKPHPHQLIRYLDTQPQIMKPISLRKKFKDWGRNRERKMGKEKEWEIEIGRGRRAQKPWKDQCDVIEEEGLLEDKEHVKGLIRCCLYLLLCLGFSFSSFSFLWFWWVLVSPWSQRSQSRYY